MMTTVEIMGFWLIQFFFWLSAAVFVYPMKKRSKFELRIVCFVVIALLYSLLVYFTVINDYTNLEIAARFLGYLLMILLLYSGWDIHISIAVYNAIWSISLWQLLTEVSAAIEILAKPFFQKYLYLSIFAIAALFLINYFICARTIATWMSAERRDRIGPRQLTSAILIFGAIEVLAFSEELRHITEYNSDWKFLYLSQLLGMIVLYLQSELFKKSALRQDLALMNLLWEKEREQYELTKENINLINQKCHDLKHQIRALRKVSKEEFDRYLNEIEDAVRIYETIVKTGNDVFDTILTEKSLYCMSREIQVSCVADGSQMDFIENIDLYAILGNAMDNAIQAVEKFKEPEKRQIDVMIHRQQNFLVMNFINPMPEHLVYDEDELPVSTKKDKRYHGYGLRSMRHFVKKYDGFMNVSEEDGCFSLKIMMPIPSEK